MTRLEALVGLNLIGEIGSIRLKRLLDFFINPQDILEAPFEKLMKISGIKEKIAQRIKSLDKKEIEKEFIFAKKHNIKIITYEDLDYPENLKNIPDPPIVLYVKGTLKPEDNLSIAIVGSRHASFYGLSSSENFAFKLAEKGFTIVSGMARGIDTFAHRGALKANGRTIAVMGSGFLNIYPEENKELVEEIAKNGAVISEFPFETKPLRQNFPQRNRVISGLSLGVLVIEAARNSGALITADFALEQAREVFALPGKIDTENSFGTHQLIKQGAKLVTSIDDILEELNLSTFFSQKNDKVDSQKDQKELIQPNLNLESQELSLYNLISDKPLMLDDIAEKTQMDIMQLSNLLLKLQMKKLILQLPGKQFIRNKNAK